METPHPRIIRERLTVEKMIYLYCNAKHGENGGSLCPDCQDLLDYASERLKNCPFQESKSTCAKCIVHCYRPVYRQKLRAVMRFSGPRMLTRHPALAVMHLFDSLRKPPQLKKKTASKRKPNVWKRKISSYLSNAAPSTPLIERFA